MRNHYGTRSSSSGAPHKFRFFQVQFVHLNFQKLRAILETPGPKPHRDVWGLLCRYEGPKGGPGMPEMLAPTSAIMGAGLGDACALITDGRFSGGSHGFVIGHVTPEAQVCTSVSLSLCVSLSLSPPIIFSRYLCLCIYSVSYTHLTLPTKRIV